MALASREATGLQSDLGALAFFLASSPPCLGETEEGEGSLGS